MAVNKVEINGETKLDLTGDTVTPETLLSGATAHNAAGEQIDGAVSVAPASNTAPKAPGTASAGSESAYARGDHVHPSDDTKQVKIKVNGIVKGIGDGSVARAIPGTDYAEIGDILTYINRNGAVNMPNTGYGYYMARGEALFSSETTPNANGCIAWVYG